MNMIWNHDYTPFDNRKHYLIKYIREIDAMRKNMQKVCNSNPDEIGMVIANVSSELTVISNKLEEAWLSAEK